MPEPVRRDVDFVSGGVVCRAWLYLPSRTARPVPCVVMAHGFGATRDSALEPYAERFAAAGYATLVFDYRHFGASDGLPRQLLSVGRQLEDWDAAIAFVRSLEVVDPDRVALWGTSFSGGHVVRAAAKDGRIAAVSSQSPMMDGVASSIAALKSGGLWSALRFGWHGGLDLARAAMGLEPHRIPIVGPPGTLAAMTAPDAAAGFRALAPPGFVNSVAARIGLLLGLYRPGRAARHLRCPILIQICETDSVAPPRAAERAAARAGRWAEVKRYPEGHFEVYTGAPFERGVRDQLEFFARHLQARQSST
jgi:fermentation-respiration switch protein FrsA (DUF1100 family)